MWGDTYNKNILIRISKKYIREINPNRYSIQLSMNLLSYIHSKFVIYLYLCCLQIWYSYRYGLSDAGLEVLLRII